MSVTRQAIFIVNVRNEPVKRLKQPAAPPLGRYNYFCFSSTPFQVSKLTRPLAAGMFFCLSNAAWKFGATRLKGGREGT